MYDTCFFLRGGGSLTFSVLEPYAHLKILLRDRIDKNNGDNDRVFIQDRQSFSLNIYF